MTTFLRAGVVGALALAVAATLAACSDADVSQGAGTATTSIEVTSTDDACELSAATAPSGEITFKVTNKGQKATEFYLLTKEEKVVAEVEDVGPATSRDLTVTAKADTYLARCKPGQTGDGITSDFVVTK